MVNENPNEKNEVRLPEYYNYENIQPDYYEYEDKKDVSILKEIKPQDSLLRIEMMLKGFKYDTILKEWVKDGEPLVNEFGRKRIISVLSFVTELTTLSNFQPEEVVKQLRLLNRHNTSTIVIKYKDYGFASLSDAANTCVGIFSFLRAAYNKGIFAGDRLVIRNVMQESRESRFAPYSPQQEQKRGFSLFGRNG